MLVSAQSKTRFQKTEVGPIPMDWLCVPIPSITARAANSIKIGPFGSSLKKEYLTDRGFKVYGQENVYAKNMSLGDRFLSPEYFKELKSCEIIPGDFLISMMGTIGECMIVPPGTRQGIMDSHLIRIRFDTARVQSRLISYLFETKIVSNQIKQLSVGGIMEGLSSKIVRSIYIPLPPTKKEQDAITAVLEDADNLISLLGLAVEKKKNIKTAVMQQLLNGKRRLNGFKNRWEKVKLGDLLMYEQPTHYLVKSTRYDNAYTTPVLTAGKTFILGYTNETVGIFRNTPVIIFDDFTTASKYVTFPFKAKSSAMKMLKPRTKGVNLRFVFEKMQLIDFQLGDHKRYWISEYQNIELEMPKPDEQAAIAKVLSDMDDEIHALKTHLKKAKELKRGMMQQLLTGNIRLI